MVARFFLPEEKLRGQAFFWRWSPKHWRQPLAHRGVYLVLLGVLCAALAWPARQAIGRSLRDPGLLSCALLVLMATGLYIGLYGWYYPVGKGDRFMGSLWVPAVFLLCWTAFGLPLPWVVLGVLVYPGVVLTARWYARASERLEADFGDVVGRR